MRFVQRVMPNRLSMHPPQAERHRLSADDVYFLLEIRECKTRESHSMHDNAARQQ